MDEAESANLQCTSCEVMFGENVEAFLSHMSEEHADDMVQCSQCREVLDSGSVFAVHYIDQHHGGGGNEAAMEEELNCPMCAFSSPEETAVTAHFESVHGDEHGDEGEAHGPADVASGSAEEAMSLDLPCPVCEASFDTEDALNVHVNGHFDGWI
jgi:hypothetical protein